MTLPAPPALRRRARSPLALPAVALAALTAAPAAAQDCWLPDALEPNDAVAVPIGVGSWTNLALHHSGPGIAKDLDRFEITIPPHQRLTLDFEYELELDPVIHPAGAVTGFVEPEDGSDVLLYFGTVGNGPDEEAVYDNPFAHPLDVIVTSRPSFPLSIGCVSYDLSIALGPRPCDVLPDDSLEGPDACGTGTVLLPGLHTDLVVFGPRRLAGRDDDVYRITDVGPRESFSIRPIFESDEWDDLVFEVFDDPSCSQTLWEWGDDVVFNQASVTRDFYVRVRTDSPSGFQRYGIDFQYEACDDVLPDAFEPNGRCGPYTPIAIGTYADLTLGDEDVDAFEVVVPPYERLVADAFPHVDGYSLAVRGAEPPGCPRELPSSTSWLNDGPTSKRYRFSVEAVTDGCTSYDLDLRLEAPFPCSDAAIARDEPNDDCATATPFATGLASGESSREVTLHPGDRDCFRIEVPAGGVWTVWLGDPNGPLLPELPTLILEAFPAGDCAEAPLRAVRPHWDWSWDGFPSLVEPRLHLANRSDRAEEWVIRVRHGDAVPSCRSYLLVCEALDQGDVDGLLRSATTSCEAPEPLRDGSFLMGPVAPGRPLHGSVALGPGQTLEVVMDDSRVRGFGAPLRLSLHAGPADCAAGGASLGTVASDPLQLPDPPLDAALRLAHTNTTGSVQRVIAELALGPRAAEFGAFARLEMLVDGGRPYVSTCSPVARSLTGIECPCGNVDESSPVLEGCANSTGSGAWLHATGSTSVAADDLLLRVEGLPPNRPAVLMHGGWASSTYHQPYFDGLLCIPAVIDHTWSFVGDGGGGWTAPAPAASTLDAAGALRSKSTLQCWYRDETGPCGARSNTTNAIRVDWEP